jgi:acyl-CoA thioesterase FadM
MILYFRFIFMIIKYYLVRNKHDPHVPFESSFYVLPTDLDFNMHLTNSRYPAFIDLARVRFLLETGVWSKFRSNRWMPVTGTMYTRFRRDLRPFTKFIVRMQIVYISPRWIYLDYKFIKDGFVHCHVLEKWGAHEQMVGMISPHQLIEPIPGAPEFQKPPSHIAKLMDAEDEFRLIVRKDK